MISVFEGDFTISYCLTNCFPKDTYTNKLYSKVSKVIPVEAVEALRVARG
jgi:hypothetical protein